MLFCSDRLQKELGLEVRKSPPTAEGTRVLGNWYCDLFWCERRKCVLFTSDLTYLSFVVLDVFRSEMRPFEGFFREHFASFLADQGIPGYVRAEVEREYVRPTLCAADSQAMAEILEELVFQARYRISNYYRGIKGVSATDVSAELSDIPVEGLKYVYPWRAARIALGLEKAFVDDEHPIISQNPRARKIGSPSLVVLDGGMSA